MADLARRATRDLSQFHMGVRTSTPFDLGTKRIDQNAKYKSCRYCIPLHFDTNPESLRSFVPEIWPNNVFNLSATYDLDLWPKILKIFVSHGVPIRICIAKFHNDRLRNCWDITLWNLRKHGQTNKQTNTHTNKHTNKQTDMGITIPRPPLWGAR